MRNRRLHLVGSTAALLAALAAIVPAHAAAARKPFILPQSRPTEDRSRPTDTRDPNRNAYSVPEAAGSPACSRHFCVHWVDQGLDAPEPGDGDGDGVPDYVERVLRVAERVHQVENGKLGWRAATGRR